MFSSEQRIIGTKVRITAMFEIGQRLICVNDAFDPHFIWPALIMGIVAIPLGFWIFNLAERYAKRTGKLHRNG